MKSSGNNALSESWVRAVNAVIRGESDRYRFVRLGPTPFKFTSYGLLQADLVMSAAKIARVRREHPDLSLGILTPISQLAETARKRKHCRLNSVKRLCGLLKGRLS